MFNLRVQKHGQRNQKQKYCILIYKALDALFTEGKKKPNQGWSLEKIGLPLFLL